MSQRDEREICACTLRAWEEESGKGERKCGKPSAIPAAVPRSLPCSDGLSI